MNYVFVPGKKSLFYKRFKKHMSKYFITNFPPRNKTELLKNIDNKLKINPVLFYECFFSFRKRDKNSIELEFEGQNLFLPRETAVDFTEYITLSFIIPPCVIC